MKALVERLDDGSGFLNYDKLTNNRPEFKAACDEGMVWTKLHWGTPFAWPQPPGLAQEALNIRCQHRPGETEVMVNIGNRVKSLMVAGIRNVDWSQLTEQALHSNPTCGTYIKSCVQYVKINSGGETNELIHELGDHQKLFGLVKGGGERTLGQEYLNKAGTLQFGKIDQYPHVVNACMKANYSCPANKVIDGVCRLLLPQHIGSLVQKDKRPQVVAAEKLMTTCRGLLNALNISPGDAVRTKLLGLLDVRLVLHILKREKEGGCGEYENMDAIAKAFM